MTKEAKQKAYYGWFDIANLEEAVEFYAEKWAFGYNLTEINKMLDVYFPKIDYITCGKIRVKALKKLYQLAKQIEKGNYVAESIMRLRRLMANPHEKTKNILAADAQLTHLLGLANIAETESLEERATLIRDFLINAREKTDGTGFAKSEQETKAEAPKDVKETKVDKEADDIDDTVKDAEDEKKVENELKLARAKRLKIEIEETEASMQRNRDRLDDECENGE